MEVLKHAGANWTAGCSAANYFRDLIAVSVRSSVLLIRAKDGANVGELRLLGRAASRVTVVAFPHVKPLSHLLAVGHESGTVRVYDVHTKRLLRIAQAQNPHATESVVALCFGAATPNLLFVVFANCEIVIFDLANCVSANSVVAPIRSWSCKSLMDKPLCLASSCMSPATLFVGGAIAGVLNSCESKCDAVEGIIAAFDIRKGNAVQTMIHSNGAVTALDVCDECEQTALMYISGASCVPSVAIWRSDTFEVAHTEFDEGKFATCPKPESHNACVAWLGSTGAQDYLAASSTASGALQFWSFSASACVLKHVFTENAAHTRQLFALVPVDGRCLDKKYVGTAAMDRRLSLWSIPGRFVDSMDKAAIGSGFNLEWDIPGFGGRVVAITCVSLSHADRFIQSQVSAEWRKTHQIDGLDLSATHLLISGCVDGTVSVDWAAQAVDRVTILKTCCRFQLPRAKGGAKVYPTSLHYTSWPSSEGNDIRHPCIVFGTNDGRMGCCILDPVSFFNSNIRSNFVALSADDLDSPHPRRGLNFKRSPSDDGSNVVAVVLLEDNSVVSLSARGHLVKWKMCPLATAEKRVEQIFVKLLEFASTVGNEISCLDVILLRKRSVNATGRFQFPDSDVKALLFITRKGYLEALDSAKVSNIENRSDTYKWNQLFTDVSTDICQVACHPSSAVFAVGTAGGMIAMFAMNWDSFDRDGFIRKVCVQLVWKNEHVHAKRLTSLRWQVSRAKDTDFKEEIADAYLEKFGVEAVSGTELIASASDDGSAKLLYGDSGLEAMCLRGHGGRVLIIFWRSWHILLTGGDDWSLRQWDVLRLPKSS